MLGLGGVELHQDKWTVRAQAQCSYSAGARVARKGGVQFEKREVLLRTKKRAGFMNRKSTATQLHNKTATQV